MKKFIPATLLLLFLQGCSYIDKKLSYFGVGNCVNQYSKDSYKGHAKLGKTYKIKGEKYTPEIDHDYKEEGLASWYGDDFHCNKTANGETFNKWELSAAHRTLPLPSVVKVTNLSNNKSIKVTINDRGPFVANSNRIIDLSESAASKLGFKHKGIEKVRVEYLHHESQNLIAKLDLPEHVYYQNNKMKVRKKTSIEEDNNSLHQFMEAVSKKTEEQQGRKILIAEFSNKKDAITAMSKLSQYGKVNYSESGQVAKKKSYQVYLTGFAGDKSELIKKMKIALKPKRAGK